MPLYDYQCKQCQTITEVRHGFNEVHTEACPKCGGPVARVFNPAGIVFKGSGFYITDSRKGGGSSESGAPAAAAAPAASTSAAAPAATSTSAAPAKKSDAA